MLIIQVTLNRNDGARITSGYQILVCSSKIKKEHQQFGNELFFGLGLYVGYGLYNPNVVLTRRNQEY